jgi:arylsulfatase A-like enzyme
MRTPFILHNPVLFPKPIESNLLNTHLDVAPTIVQLLGLTAAAAVARPDADVG